jgi:hypothetical protein
MDKDRIKGVVNVNAGATKAKAENLHTLLFHGMSISDGKVIAGLNSPVKYSSCLVQGLLMCTKSGLRDAWCVT